MNRRLFLLAGLGIAIVPEATAQARPRVLIFPTTLGRLAVATEEKPGPDGLTDGDRINFAARAVREQLDAENVVTTLLYDGSDAFFKKALASTKLKVGMELDEAARLKIGTEVGAHYVLTVYSRLSIDPGPPPAKKTPERAQGGLAAALGQKPVEQITLPPIVLGSGTPMMELEAIEIKPGGKPGKRWQERAAVSSSLENGRRQPGAIPPGMASAARTLVYQLLGGPLREFSKSALDPSLLPPPVKPKAEPVEVPPLDFDAETTRLLQEAQEQLRRDQPVAAIALLRQAVNYQPRSAAPRLLLAQAYQRAHRLPEATNEARRALKMATGITPDQRGDLNRLLAQVLVEEGNQEGATQLFNQLLAENPNNTEARLGLAELLLEHKQLEAAEIQYRLIRERNPASVEAAQGLARLLLARGAFDDVIKETKSSVPEVQNAMATLAFIETASGLAARMVQNRAAWEESKLSREIFYKATVSQSSRAKQLAELLGSMPPAESAPEPLRLSHNRRVLAANLLSQSLASLQAFLETGEAATGVRARTLLNEFYTEMKDARNPGKSS